MYFIRKLCKRCNMKIALLPSFCVNSGFCAHIRRIWMFLLGRFSVLRYLEEEYTIFCKQDLGTVLSSKLICCLKSCDVRIGLIIPTNRRNNGFLFLEFWHTFETGIVMNIDFPGSVISVGPRKTPAFWIIQSIRGLKSLKLSSGTGCHVV